MRDMFPNLTCRDGSEGNNGMEFESDLWSDDSQSDKLSRLLSDNSSKGCDSVSEDSSLDQPVSWSTPESFGSIYLEYFESCSPNWRIPLADKVIWLVTVRGFRSNYRNE